MAWPGLILSAQNVKKRTARFNALDGLSSNFSLMDMALFDEMSRFYCSPGAILLLPARFKKGPILGNLKRKGKDEGQKKGFEPGLQLDGLGRLIFQLPGNSLPLQSHV